MLWIVCIELGIIVNIGFELCNYIYIYAIYSFMHFVSFIAFFVALFYNQFVYFFFSFTIFLRGIYLNNILFFWD
jgi:hypothetical protein